MHFFIQKSQKRILTFCKEKGFRIQQVLMYNCFIISYYLFSALGIYNVMYIYTIRTEKTLIHGSRQCLFC